MLQLVRNEYEELFAGEEVAANIVYNTNSLDPLVKEYDGMLRDLEDLIDDYASQKSRGKDVKRKEVCPHPTAEMQAPHCCSPVPMPDLGLLVLPCCAKL